MNLLFLPETKLVKATQNKPENMTIQRLENNMLPITSHGRSVLSIYGNLFYFLCYN